jgi:predicted permease
MRDVPLPQAMVAFHIQHQRTFESVAAYAGAGFTLTGTGDPERLTAANVTRDFFRVLGVQPMYGRTFTAEEDSPGKNLVTILSYSFWRRRFNSDLSILGKPLDLNGIPTVVIGIMPPTFDFPAGAALWVPVGLNPTAINNWYLTGIGRMKAGVTVAGVMKNVNEMTDAFWLEHPDPNRAPIPPITIAQPLVEDLVGNVQTPLLALLAAVGLVLLIVCANIANLVLARSISRHRELAVRYCLGASPRRILAQSLTESLLLSVIGATLGLAFAWVTLLSARPFLGSDVPRIENLRIDFTVVLFTAVVALVASSIFGLVPALKALRVNLQDALKDNSRATSGSASSRRWNSVFVVAQFAMCVTLCVGALLLMRSFSKLISVDPGFKPDNLLIARIALPSRQYETLERAQNFYSQLKDRVSSLPGMISS